MRPAAPAIVTRGTIDLGSVETGDAVYQPPTAVGGGPPAQQK